MDQFSLLHFATGIVAYFWGISLAHWFILHALFEIWEDTETGLRLINKFFGEIWPGGGKKVPDSFLNSELGDNLFAVLGWVFAQKISEYSKK